jgi:apolipoprotein N-acyltransferase
MRFPWPQMDALSLSRLIWWAIAIVAVAALLWLVSGAVRRFQGEPPEPGRPPAE